MSTFNTSKITFSEFDISDGMIYFTFYEFINNNKTNGHIYFKLTPAIKPKSDLIALAISTLCGKKYNAIHFDLCVSQSIITSIAKFTQSDVTALQSSENCIHRENQNNITLNFSGGFDSLAAKCLMPDNTNLVSINFGGSFARERSFFKKFSPCTVSTNLIETPLRYNSWSFMGISSILFSDFLQTNYHTFGSILEAGTNNFTDSPISAKNISFPPFLAAGIENAPYVLGLTEVGTIKVLGQCAPELIRESLDSLANPGEEKRFRKQVLSTIVSEKMKMNFNLNMVSPPQKPHFMFGKSFAADFLSFYVIKNAGINIASRTVSNIPDEVVRTATNLSLKFYERLNTNFLINFPQPFLGDLLKKLAIIDVIPYTSIDWKEFYEVKNILAKYYEIR